MINRNFPNQRVRRPYVIIPQNAWPWEGPKFGLQERAKLTVMRAASEIAMRRAAGVIRVSGSIPPIGRTHDDFLPNPLDAGFEDAVAGIEGSTPPSDSPYFASVGSLNSYRGLETLLTAYGRYRESGGSTPLLITGGANTKYLSHLSGLASRYEGVDLRPGGVSRRDCLHTLHHARLVVLPSHVEASPFSLLEALAVQPRVAASDIPGHRGIIPEGTGHPAYFTHAQPEGLTRLLHDADRDSHPPEAHAVASLQFRVEARNKWGNTLMAMLEDLASRN